MDLDQRLLSILKCPQCGGPLKIAHEKLVCSACNAVYPVEGGIPALLPSVEPSEAISQFDYLTHYKQDSEQFDYFERRGGATAHSERRLREYIQSFVPQDATSILDVGCGSAWVAKAYQNSGTFVCSLDISAVNPRKAIERYPFADHVGVAADTYHLPFMDGSFDCIIAAEIIEHVPDPKAFADQLMRVLRPGGTVIVSTPFKEKLVFEQCIHCHQQTPHNAHLHSWDEGKLRSLFRLSSARTEFASFNNKLLLYGRTYPLLKLLPFTLWKAADSIANLIVNKRVNCILSVTKT